MRPHISTNREQNPERLDDWTTGRCTQSFELNLSMMQHDERVGIPAYRCGVVRLGVLNHERCKFRRRAHVTQWKSETRLPVSLSLCFFVYCICSSPVLFAVRLRSLRIVGTARHVGILYYSGGVILNNKRATCDIDANFVGIIRCVCVCVCLRVFRSSQHVSKHMYIRHQNRRI